MRPLKGWLVQLDGGLLVPSHQGTQASTPLTHSVDHSTDPRRLDSLRTLVGLTAARESGKRRTTWQYAIPGTVGKKTNTI